MFPLFLQFIGSSALLQLLQLYVNFDFVLGSAMLLIVRPSSFFNLARIYLCKNSLVIYDYEYSQNVVFPIISSFSHLSVFSGFLVLFYFSYSDFSSSNFVLLGLFPIIAQAALVYKLYSYLHS